MDDYLTPKEVATELGVSYREVMDRINKGELSAICRSRVYFIHKDDVAKMKANQK